jgi:hypothetical protein
MTWQIIVLVSIGAITISRLLQKGLVKANEENPVGYSIISPMHQTSTLLIVIMSIFLFKEKDRMLQKFLAAILGVVGAMILAA